MYVNPLIALFDGDKVSGRNTKAYVEVYEELMTNESIATPFEYFDYNFGYDIVEDSTKAMREFDGEWDLPKDFF
jgi:hypothetical protein